MATIDELCPKSREMYKQARAQPQGVISKHVLQVAQKGGQKGLRRGEASGWVVSDETRHESDKRHVILREHARFEQRRRPCPRRGYKRGETSVPRYPFPRGTPRKLVLR